MTDTSKKPGDQKAAALLAALKHRAIDSAVEKAVNAGGFALVHPNALRDLQRIAHDELAVNESGEIRRGDGRFVELHAWLTEAHQTKPFLFAPASRPGSPYAPPADAAATRSPGPRTLPPGVQKVIPANQMGANLQAIADGKIVVELAGDPTT